MTVEQERNLAEPPLKGKAVLVTGAARRIGRALALGSARAGADVVIHYCHSGEEAAGTKREIESMGRRAWMIQADFEEPAGIPRLIEGAASLVPLFGLVNSAAIFEAREFQDTSLSDWHRNLAVNLTAPYLLTQSFARQLAPGQTGRVVNILDWRALHAEAGHLAYTISKAGLAALTRSLALALAPSINVNGLALGAILPHPGGPAESRILDSIPAGRWGQLIEVEDALIFLLSGPAYVTGEIIHVDGGRHLV
jgi:NAD(P)-dependent dehydrogenase (short-subunit alcohol dehydrogenase family)